MISARADYDSHTILSRVKVELEDESRWQINPYWTSDHIKQVQIIWHTSKLIYNFFKAKQNEIDNSEDPHIYDQLFQLKKRHKADNIESYKQSISTIFDDDSHSIILDWDCGTRQLTNSTVNNSINGLTAQHICLYVKIPFYTGLCLKTGFSQYWQHNGRNFTHSVFPYYHQYKMNCYISSDRGIYARSPGAEEEQRTITPIKCTTMRFCPYYTHWHNGKRAILIDNQVIFYRHRTWQSAGPHMPFGGDYSSIMHEDGFMYNKNNGQPLIDVSTGSQVRGTDYIRPGFAYKFGL